MRKITGLMMGVFFTFHFSFCTVINVPSDQPGIQAGIDASADGDTVLVQPGTYIENINFNGKNIVVSSLYIYYPASEYIDITVINGSEPDDYLFGTSLATFINDEDSTAVLSGFTLRSGYGSYLAGGGGGIVIFDASPTIANCIIENNHSVYYDFSTGGGISAINSSSSFNNIVVRNNSAQDGGGLFILSSNIIMTDVIVEDNWALTGGGILSKYSQLEFRNVSIRENVGENNGGGIKISGFDSHVWFDENLLCSIYGNTSNRGADIYFSDINEYQTVTLDTFTVNAFTDYYVVPIDSLSGNINNSIFQLAGPELYVSPSGDNANSGTDPDEPFQTIRHAYSMIEAGPQTPGIIHLIPGNYSFNTNQEVFPIYGISYVSVTGSAVDSTVIDADGMDVIFRLGRVKNVILQNMTLINGDMPWWFGGAVRLDKNSTAEISNLNIFNCSANRGGAVYIGDSSYLEMEQVLMAENMAYNNYLYGTGGAVYCDGNSTVIMDRVTTTRNFNGGIFIHNSSQMIINNSIFYEDTLYNGILEEITFSGGYNSSFIQISFTNIEQGLIGINLNDNGEVSWLEGNLDADPLFVDPDNGDYHIQSDSPCIDAGDPDSPLDPDGTIADMGAFYFDQNENCSLPGDMNNDNQIDVLDIVGIVGCILSDIDDCSCGDVNGDNSVDVSDVVQMVEDILEN